MPAANCSVLHLVLAEFHRVSHPKINQDIFYSKPQTDRRVWFITIFLYIIQTFCIIIHHISSTFYHIYPFFAGSLHHMMAFRRHFPSSARYATLGTSHLSGRRHRQRSQGSPSWGEPETSRDEVARCPVDFPGRFTLQMGISRNLYVDI